MQKQDDIDIAAVEKFLPGISLFKNLDNKIVRDIVRRMSLHSYQTGEYLIRKSEPGQYMLIVRQGKINVGLDDRVVELGRGEAIGEMALISCTPSKADVVAQTEVEALALYRNVK